jgi:hypothetical protein
LVIECNRVRPSDNRALQWLFLIPQETPRITPRASCFEVEAPIRASDGSKKWSDIRLWDEVKVIPASPESEFCVLVGDDPNKQTILGARCSELLESIEGLAEEEASLLQSLWDVCLNRRI